MKGFCCDVHGKLTQCLVRDRMVKRDRLRRMGLMVSVYRYFILDVLS